MKDYRKSEYAKNKMNRTAIVYTHTGEVEVRLTFEKVSIDQPEITEEEFQIFKDASDEFFRIIENNDSREERKKACSFSEEIESRTAPVNSAEEEYINIEDQNDMQARISRVFATLTETEKRRFEMMFIKGYSLKKIAEIEGCNSNAVECTKKAIRKKFAKEFPERHQIKPKKRKR